MKILNILYILSKYNINRDYPFWAEHDVIGFNVDPEEISEQDLLRLNNLGVFYDDEEYYGLIMYV